MQKIKEETQHAGLDKKATKPTVQPVLQQSIGNPDCPLCKGIGFLRQDLPLGHPDFGKVEICPCRQAEVTRAVRNRLYQLSNLTALSHLTFDSFLPRGRVGLGKIQADTLQQAYNTAQNFVQSMQGWLMLYGPYGCGKTHLAAAIANQAVNHQISTIFLTAPDLLDWLRSAYSNTSDFGFEGRFEQIKTIELLVLDDFGTQNTTPWAQEKLYQILNYRYINKLPTVITTNLGLEDIEGRIRSRLMDPALVQTIRIFAPDFRNPTDDTGHPELSSLSLHHKQTFGNFSLRREENLIPADLKSIQEAFKAAQKFAENPQGWLVINGPYGSGKTHLAAAIGNYQAAIGIPPLMVSVPDLLDHLRASFSPQSTTSLDRRFEEVRTSALLILDDLGTQSATPWAREKLYQLFNYRYNAELPTVITSSSSADEMDPRLYSRMQDRSLCKIIVINAPAYRNLPENQKKIGHK